jgi:alpha-amylase/alpha-mannosidase (GH57 family)
MGAGQIERQDSAAPYHDWNERITVECYGPNTAARVLGPDGLIVDLVDNYEHISFNVGPTLMSWMERHATEVYRAIVEADRRSAQRLGHGNAIAQAYGHCILPLANRRDKTTQVRWGIIDFERRFGRRPEGMWLPECAVDEETLCVLADEGIRFTILGPNQALSSRLRSAVVPPTGEGVPPGAEPPQGPTGDPRSGQGLAHGERREGVDPRHPHRALLPGGRFVDIFFYDGYVARSIAFEDGLRDAETFAGRLLAAFDPASIEPQLVSVAVDGETFGHHRPFGDMALAATIRRLQHSTAVQMTNFATYLADHAPRHEVQLRMPSAWSCAHGVERWRDDCGCVTAVRVGWSQQWRRPLRAALEVLRDGFDELFEQRAARLFRALWEARDRYAELLVGHHAAHGAGSEAAAREVWLHERGVPAEPSARTEALTLLELQRNSLFMFTSCGWFFEELSGLEGVQILRYAARALQLARELWDSEPTGTGRGHWDALEQRFLATLAEARSNLPEYADGAAVFQRHAQSAVAPLSTIALHVAAAELVGLPLAADGRLFGYGIQRTPHKRLGPGQPPQAEVELGDVVVTSPLTGASSRFAYVAANDDPVPWAAVVAAGARGEGGPAPVVARLAEAVEGARNAAGEGPWLHRLENTLVAEHGAEPLALARLFVDHRRRVVQQLMLRAMERRGNRPARMLAEYSDLLTLSVEHGVPPPPVLLAAAGEAIRERIEGALMACVPGDAVSMRETCRLARQSLEAARSRRFEVELTALVPRLGELLSRSVEAIAARFEGATAPTDGQADDPSAPIDAAVELLELAHDLGLRPTLWTAQNALWRFVSDATPLATPPAPAVTDRLVRLAVWLGFDSATVRARLGHRTAAVEFTPSRASEQAG